MMTIPILEGLLERVNAAEEELLSLPISEARVVALLRFAALRGFAKSHLNIERAAVGK